MTVIKDNVAKRKKANHKVVNVVRRVVRVLRVIGIVWRGREAHKRKGRHKDIEMEGI